MFQSKASKIQIRPYKSSARITFIAALFFVLAGVIIFRLFALQIVKHSFFEKVASGQHEILEELIPNRGKIYVTDKNGNLFAIADNKELYLLYGVPAKIKSASTTLEALAGIFELNEEERTEFFKRLSKKNDPYEPLKHYLTPEQKKQIELLQIQGLGFRSETKRFYPEKNIFSHLTGFLGFRGNRRIGQYGLEEYFEDQLRGKEGFLKSEKDAAGRLIGVGNFDIQEAEDGADIYLTMDRLVQFKACDTLAKAIGKYGASGGVAIVQRPNTGEILGMCSNPDFDPNNYSQVESIKIYNNQALSSQYEPGSTFKPITMAAALDTESVTPATTYEDKGVLVFGKDTITNAENKKYGQVSMTQVLEDSINTGAVFAAQKVGRLELRKYVEGFGFGAKTGISLPGEAYGDISSLGRKSDIYLATASFGQGIAVTPLQLINAFSAIANGGILYRPSVVKKIKWPNGKEKNFNPQQIRRVVSSKTANVLKAMLVSVIKNGHGVNAQIKGYNVGGKTGTAQVAGPGGGYVDAYNHTFVGFAPVSQPEFVVLVKLNRPTRGRFAANTAAPAFAEIMKFLLNYYEIPTEY